MSIPGPRYSDLQKACFQSQAEAALYVASAARRDVFGLRELMDAAKSSDEHPAPVQIEIQRRVNTIYPLAQVLSVDTRSSIRCLGQALLTFLDLQFSTLR